MNSIAQDLGAIPPDYLVPAGDGGYAPADAASAARRAEDVWKGTYHEEGADLYPEWDHGRQHYRKNWCVMREIDVTPAYDDVLSRARLEQARRPGSRTCAAPSRPCATRTAATKRQTAGDDIDLDALVEALADARTGAK